MAGKLREKFPDDEVELIKGDKGIFDVTVDDELIYSKHEREIGLLDVDEEEIVEIVDNLEK